jgi:anaerobic magnesium-protoporphyrin IX monomethyl ester cyclase
MINPNWTFEGSIYFGCADYHLPLEYGYAKALLEAAGHEVIIIDAHLRHLSNKQTKQLIEEYQPDITVVSTAPTYLFWRCPPPELAIPLRLVESIRPAAGITAAIGPHGSVTPGMVLKKLGCDVVIRGEPEEVLPLLSWPRHDWQSIPSICYRQDDELVINGSPHVANMKELDAIAWPNEFITLHKHQHHRFDREPLKVGAEIESSRGCPFSCSFCAKQCFRNKYRRRDVASVLNELDGLITQGIEYVYFIDEIFMPDLELLGELAARDISFGIQTRIDLWQPEMLDALGRAGCVSVEVGVESISEEGRRRLNKNCRLTTDQVTDLLIRAKAKIPFVQATLMDSGCDDAEEVETWRGHVQKFGVWANKPVPVFPYPGSEEYRRRCGSPDDNAWDRAHEYYLHAFETYSDIQSQKMLSISELEAIC